MDVKKNKIFLRRTHCDELLLKDLFLGNTVKLFSRILKIVNYADIYTRQFLESTNYQCSIALLRPHANDNKSELFQDLMNYGFEFINILMLHFNEEIKRVLNRKESTSRYVPTCIVLILCGIQYFSFWKFYKVCNFQNLKLFYWISEMDFSHNCWHSLLVNPVMLDSNRDFTLF